MFNLKINSVTKHEQKTLSLIFATGLIVVWVILKLSFPTIRTYTFYGYTIPVRILVAIWVYKINEKDKFLYAVGAFILPLIMLLIEGLRKRK
jgi:hypothetical protein